jgi:hypothetical protein
LGLYHACHRNIYDQETDAEHRQELFQIQFQDQVKLKQMERRAAAGQGLPTFQLHKLSSIEHEIQLEDKM